MMLYKNIKDMVHSPIVVTNFIDVVIKDLLRDTLAPYLFIICLNYVSQTSIDLTKGNSFTLKIDKKQTISLRNYDNSRLCR